MFLLILKIFICKMLLGLRFKFIRVFIMYISICLCLFNKWILISFGLECFRLEIFFVSLFVFSVRFLNFLMLFFIFLCKWKIELFFLKFDFIV